MRVFVAGATGAIGQQLVPRLVAAGHEVHGMTRSESKQPMLYELGAVPVVADALDRGSPGTNEPLKPVESPETESLELVGEWLISRSAPECSASHSLRSHCRRWP
jgi:nucleoside-diphosphate-sugar epimerase